MAQFKWETQAGMPTFSLLYSQLNEKLIECQEICTMMAHLRNADGGPMDNLLAKGWLGMSELFRRMQFQIIELGKKKLS